MGKLQQLLQEHERLTREIEAKRAATRDQAIAQIRKLVQDYELTPAELGLGPTAPRRISPRRGQKVPPKFADPDTGQTWTGRGMAPQWFKRHLDAGKTPQDLAVNNSTLSVPGLLAPH